VADLVHLAVLAVLAPLAAGVVAYWIAAALAWRDVTRGNRPEGNGTSDA
jgi:hypothetical protein